MPPAPSSAAAAAAALSSGWGGEFDRIYSAVVLGLPPLIARAALGLPSGEARGTVVDAVDAEGVGTSLTPAEAASLAVGSALVSACQGLLTDAEVVTLLREAVAARVDALLRRQGGAAPV